jgi:dynein heavy chain 1
VVAAPTTASAWLHDFKNRVEQLQHLSGSTDHGRSGIKFGGLLAPEAFLIATQQATAQLQSWSLEESELTFEFAPTEEEVRKAVDEQLGFVITGLSIESAELDAREKKIKMAAKLSSPLPTILLKWVKKAASKMEEYEHVDLPVYLNRSRKQLLCSVAVPTGGVPAHSWYQRGVALFAGAD